MGDFAKMLETKDAAQDVTVNIETPNITPMETEVVEEVIDPQGVVNNTIECITAWCALSFFTCLLYAFSITLLGLEYGIITHSSMDTIIISPFPEIVDQFAPDSSSTCYYPPFTSFIPNTFPCNFTSTTRDYYCPVGYACQVQTLGGTTPYGCLSEDINCGNYESCALGLTGLPYSELTDYHLAKELEVSVISWPLYIGLLSTSCGIVALVVCAGLSASLKVRANWGNFVWIFSCASLIVGLGVVVVFVSGIFFMVYSDAPLYYSGDCFDYDVNASLRKLIGLGVGYLEIYLIGVVMTFFFCLMGGLSVIFCLVVPHLVE